MIAPILVGRLLHPAERELSPDARPPDQQCHDPAMNVLVIVNDQPYGSERPYNALRLANALSKRDRVNVHVFLFGDAVACAIAGQQLPEGHHHLDRMLKGLLHRARVGCCGTCLDARGPNEAKSSRCSALNARGTDRLDDVGG
jgi:uncharacterized protein involved in oxidation of intracellular sulfur